MSISNDFKTNIRIVSEESKRLVDQGYSMENALKIVQIACEYSKVQALESISQSIDVGAANIGYLS